MKDTVDIHTHTIASGHAYNTINELIAAAVKKKVSILGITEHAPAMPGSCTRMYFMNFKVLPRERNGITVLYGAELNILDRDGHVDMPRHELKQMDVTIASMHTPCYISGSKKENTQAYLNIMKNPYINIIGHPDDLRFPIEYEALVEGAKKYDTLLEINNGSLVPGSFRGNPVDIYQNLLKLCKEYEVPVIVNSDAHVDLDVGVHNYAMAVVTEMEFPEHLLVNANPQMLKKYLNYYKK